METIRNIKANPIPDRYARGWHCLGLAANFRDGAPHAIDAFGSRLVVFCGEDSKICVLDAYCPHMGADLSRGIVKGNSVICPFHNWSWGNNGVCNAIPYAERIPPAARTRVWQTLEQNKLLFVWNDPEGKSPSPEFDIPRLEACYSDDWTDWVIEKWHIKANCRELIDNVSDVAHFLPVHGVPVQYFANIFEGHKATQVMLSKDRLLTYATYYGPAYQITAMEKKMCGLTIHSILLNCHVPVTTHSFDLYFGMLVRKIPEFNDEKNNEMVQTYIQRVQQGFYQDVAIWNNKVRIDNPLLCRGDGPITHLRQWYQQFYVDEVEVPLTLRERRIFELNPDSIIEVPSLHHAFEC
jgi:3-ketosteroid 9alpha-monooxygenase subunit A